MAGGWSGKEVCAVMKLILLYGCFRSKGQVGMAPASYLTPLSGSKEDVDGGVKPNYLVSIECVSS